MWADLVHFAFTLIAMTTNEINVWQSSAFFLCLYDISIIRLGISYIVLC